ncbi:inositol-trisphosphate 3-kinase homolog isoform X2 [Nilaparvata lugens]|uniref:inositol-trisphosphate 3-kinase homolog isoform X2 n=1 Tax=Nilaparvata lugens TaxID=108931 RepID=UPI00193DA544|nr:inositol-trisphosphate 3-kinase homolog isoform X2 [Nilaparvata lugens]
MDVNKPIFPPDTYSTSYNLRDDIKQYLIRKGLAIFPNGVMVARNKHKQSGETWKNTNCNLSSPKRCRRRDEEHSLLKFLALNALELTAPASDVLLRQSGTTTTTTNGGSPPTHWVQLSGHPDTFAPAGPGTVWKKCGGGAERSVYEALNQEPSLKDVTPRFLREVHYAGQTFIELEDLLQGFRDPNVMDIKMGTRTFLETEVQNLASRPDLYLKMVALDPTAPTPEEHASKSVTKLRYMQFREQQSSTCSLGFRIEAMKFRGTPPVTDLKRVKSLDEVVSTMSLFLGDRDDVRLRLVARLADIRTKLENSKYFKHHEVVGSSILIIYDDCKVGAWMIDFAKTRPLPEGVTVNHRSPWAQGNHEDGFLFGLDQLVRVVEQVEVKGEVGEATCKGGSSVALKS